MSQRLLTFSALVAIMLKRALFTANMLNRKVVATIIGDGNVIDVKDKAGNLVQSADGSGILQKRIFNLNATSELQRSNPLNVALLQRIKALHTAGPDGKPVCLPGKEQEAHDLINEYLNKTQISFSVLSGTSHFDSADLQNGAEISAKLIEVTTDKGSLWTMEPSSISVAEPIVPESANFDFSLAVGSVPPVVGAVPPVPVPVPVGPVGLDPNQTRMYQGTAHTVASLRNSGWTDAQIEANTTL